jgi:hypothetical protein
MSDLLVDSGDLNVSVLNGIPAWSATCALGSWSELHTS